MPTTASSTLKTSWKTRFLMWIAFVYVRFLVPLFHLMLISCFRCVDMGAEKFEEQFTVQWKEVFGNEILLPQISSPKY